MSDRRTWISLGLVLALGVVLAGYYYVHKPITPSQAAAIASALADAVVAMLLTLLGGGLGRRLICGWMLDAPGERVAVQAALGWGVCGLAMLALGLIGLYYPALVWMLVVLALLLLWRDVLSWLGDVRAALKTLWLPSRLSRLAGLFVFLTLGLGLLRALAPPVMWDALVYHLTLPKLYAQAHGVRLEADILFTGMPQLTEMLYTAATLMRGAIAAQVLGWAMGLVLTLGLAGHAAELLGARFTSLAPALLFSALTLAFALFWAYGELLVMLMALALLIALRQWRRGTPGRWLLLGGFLAGLAVGCKYTGALVALGGASMIVWQSFWETPPAGQKRWAQAARNVAGFGAAALLVFAPWLSKNWLYTGSPTYPLIFAAGYMDAPRQWFYARPDLVERDPVWAVLLFFRAAFLGVQSANDYDATIGPLLAFLLVGLAAGWRGLEKHVRREICPLVVFALAVYAGWVLLTFISTMMLQTRFFFPAFPALAILSAAGVAAIASLDTSTLRASMILRAVLILILALSALENVLAFVARSPLAYLVGAQSAADYRAQSLGTYVTAMDKVNALPVGSRVVFLWETRSLECAASVWCEPDAIIDRWWHLRRTKNSAQAILADWKARGVTHVLIYEAGLDFVRAQNDAAFAPDDWTELDRLRAQMRLADQWAGYSLYTLVPN